MTEPPDFVAAYLAIALGDGAKPDDPRLFALFERMTPQGVEALKQRLFAEYVKTLPGAPMPSDAPVADFAELYLELVRRRARPDDPRLAALMDGMSPAEVERCKAALGELWLQSEPRPARLN
jgi:hypothetical protein